MVNTIVYTDSISEAFGISDELLKTSTLAITPYKKLLNRGLISVEQFSHIVIGMATNENELMYFAYTAGMINAMHLKDIDKVNTINNLVKISKN